MTREDVIRLAREAGFDMPETVATTDSDWHYREVAGMWERVDRLIRLAREDEREALAKEFGHIEIKIGDAWVHLDDYIRARGEK